MSRLLRFLLVLVLLSLSLPLSFALTSHNLHKSVHAVQKELRLKDWQVLIRSLSVEEMTETNHCKCYGESMLFPASQITVVNILDDEAYQEMGWTGLKAIHAHQRFVVLHELLHVSVMISSPDLSHDAQEEAVRESSVMIVAEPEKR